LTCAVITETIAAPDLSVAFLGKENVYTAGEAIVFKFDDVTATKFLTHPMSSGCTNWPRLEKGKGKKRAAGVPAASVATAVELGGEDGGTPPAKSFNCSLLVGAVYAMVLGRARGRPPSERALHGAEQ
jgi:hypothetical protein